jgi:dynamin 1-like protein
MVKRIIIQSIITTIWGNGESHQHIHDPRILKIGNVLSAVLKHVPMEIKIPQMITVGSQSSGKSSVINGILAMDLLPTGKNMVTRTPLRLELIESNITIARIEFGEYDNDGKWESNGSFPLTVPIPSTQEVQRFRDRINTQTDELAGTGQNISADEINVRMYSPNVHNLTLIDLPGLTAVACTDRGQPKDIKEKIISLVTSYIEKKESIILAIMPARTDLEADTSLAMVKQFDPKGDRTIGILTKVDLMEKDSHVGDYLLNRISVDLKLKHGYFAVKNRSSSETKNHTIIQGFGIEKTYFGQHQVYKTESSNLRCGIPSLSKYLTGILRDELMHIIPALRAELSTLDSQLLEKLQVLGDPVPKTEALQVTQIQKLIMKYSQHFLYSLKSRVGRAIKEAFIQFRHEIGSIAPFSEDNCSDEYIQTMLKNCEGNHMNFLYPPIEVLEACLINKEYNAFARFHPFSQQLLDQIKLELIGLGKWAATQSHIARYPALSMYVDHVIEEAIIQYCDSTSKTIREIVEMEEAYIWTDSYKFHEVIDKKELIHNMRIMLDTYFTIIIGHIQHAVPKAIMHGVVRKMERNLTEHLITRLDPKNAHALLIENQEQSSLRGELQLKYDRILIARNTLKEIS